MKRSALVTFAFLSVVAATPAYAQEVKPSQRSETPKAGQTPEKMEEARQRFQRGLQLYDEKNFEAARVELERAYQIAPTWKLLYNIGLCYAERGDYVEAVKDLEQYSKEGAAEISKERRDEVESKLASLRPRIAYLEIKTNVPDADLQIDDQPEGKVTTSPVMVNPGKRKVSITKPGYFPVAKVVTPASSDHVEVNLEMKQLPKEYVERKNPWTLPTVIAWGGTAVGLLGGGVLAYFSTQAADDLKTKRDTVGVSSKDLDDQASSTKTLALVTDITFAASIIGAGISTYCTYKLLTWKGGAEDEKEKDKDKDPNKLKVDVGFSPMGVFAAGTF